MTTFCKPAAAGAAEPLVAALGLVAALARAAELATGAAEELGGVLAAEPPQAATIKPKSDVLITRRFMANVSPLDVIDAAAAATS